MKTPVNTSDMPGAFLANFRKHFITPNLLVAQDRWKTENAIYGCYYCIHGANKVFLFLKVTIMESLTEQRCHQLLWQFQVLFGFHTYSLSTNSNLVLVLGWCWCQFAVGSTSEPSKNQLAFPRAREPSHYIAVHTSGFRATLAKFKHR